MVLNILEAKRNLNVTWDDPDTDAKINDVYDAAEAYLSDYAGHGIDYSTNIVAKQLLKDLARYIWNDCLDEFERRYQSHILALRNTFKVENYEDDTGKSEVREGEEDEI